MSVATDLLGRTVVIDRYAPIEHDALRDKTAVIRAVAYDGKSSFIYLLEIDGFLYTVDTAYFKLQPALATSK